MIDEQVSSAVLSWLVQGIKNIRTVAFRFSIFERIYQILDRDESEILNSVETAYIH